MAGSGTGRAATARGARTIYSDDDFDHETGAAAYDFDDDHPDEPRRTRWLFAAGGVAVVAGIVISLMTLFNGNGGAPVKNTDIGRSTPSTSTKTAQKKAPAVPPSEVTVGVLNGSNINGLGSKVQTKVANATYSARPAQTANTGGVAKTTTTVAYRTGYRASALAIAKLLGLPSSAVQPITSDVSLAAGADVVVTVGSDLSSLAATGTGTTTTTTPG